MPRFPRNLQETFSLKTAPALSYTPRHHGNSAVGVPNIHEKTLRRPAWDGPHRLFSRASGRIHLGRRRSRVEQPARAVGRWAGGHLVSGRRHESVLSADVHIVLDRISSVGTPSDGLPSNERGPARDQRDSCGTGAASSVRSGRVGGRGAVCRAPSPRGIGRLDFGTQECPVRIFFSLRAAGISQLDLRRFKEARPIVRAVDPVVRLRPAQQDSDVHAAGGSVAHRVVEAGPDRCVERHHVGALGPELGLSMAERALIAGRAVWFYLWKLVWPHPLAFFYPRWPVDAGQFFQYLPPIAVLAVLAGLWRLRARWGKGPWVAAAYFLITLFPALGFFNVYPMRFSFVADHFQYLAAIGPIAMGAAGLGRMAAPPARLCSGLLIVLFGLLTWNQSMIYRSEERLWRGTIAQRPEAWMPPENLGLLLVKQERFEEAARLFETAIRLKPDRAHAYSNLAGCLDRLGRTEEAQRLCEEAILIISLHVLSHYNLGLILERRGRIEEAIAEYLASLKGNPHYVFARANLGMLLAGQGRPAEALAHLREAVRMAPERTEVRVVLDRVAAEVEQRRAG